MIVSPWTGVFVNTFLTVSFACVPLFNCVSAREEFVPYQDSHPSSYFEVLHDVSNKIGYLGDEQNVNDLKNVSSDVFHLYRRVNNMVFGDDNKVTRGFTDLLTDLEEIEDVLNRETNGNDEKVSFDHSDHNTPSGIAESFKHLKRLKSKENASLSTCINDTGRLITAILDNEGWAIQFFDAMGKPGPSITQLRLAFVGNYDQCRAARAPPSASGKERKDGGQFKGSYFTIVVKPTKIPLEIKLGACFPDTCSGDEITVLVNQLFRKEFKSRSLQYAYTISQKGETEMTAATIAAISILSIIGVFVLIGTCYDLGFVQRPTWLKPKTSLSTNAASIDMANGHNHPVTNGATDRSMSNSENTPLLPTTSNGTMSNIKPATGSIGTLAQIFISFSIYSNGKKVLNTAQAPGSLGSIHGIRFLSMSWVVMCHMFAFSPNFALDLVTAMPEFYSRWTFLPISNGFVCVDTFFTLSGLLTSYLTIKEMTRRNTFKINWPLFYFHRFWRLTPPYMFAMVIVLGLMQYMGQGALWSPVQPYDKKNCEDSWWTNLLYVNNLVDVKNGCFGHAWYLANDMQFFFLSPLMLIPFYFHRIAGIISCSLFLLASWIATGVLSHNRKWPTNSGSLHPVPGRAGQGEWMEHYYVVPWCRIGPFIVGVIAGYILACTKGRQFKMPWWLAVIGWTMATGYGLAVVYGLYGDIKGDHPSTLEAAAFYNAVNRSVWGAGVSWVIIACSAGYGGPVNALLSWSPFVVLGRLTYMSYLIHICIVYTFYQNLDSLFSFNDTNIVVYYLGILVFVNLSAFVGVLALESPMLGLEKTFIRREKKE